MVGLYRLRSEGQSYFQVDNCLPKCFFILPGLSILLFDDEVFLFNIFSQCLAIVLSIESCKAEFCVHIIISKNDCNYAFFLCFYPMFYFQCPKIYSLPPTSRLPPSNNFWSFIHIVRSILTLSYFYLKNKYATELSPLFLVLLRCICEF